MPAHRLKCLKIDVFQYTGQLLQEVRQF